MALLGYNELNMKVIASLLDENWRYWGMHSWQPEFISLWTSWLPFRRWHFQMHFYEWKFPILIWISLQYVPKGLIDNKPALVQIMAWRHKATSHYVNQWWLDHWRVYASLGLIEFNTLSYNQAVKSRLFSEFFPFAVICPNQTSLSWWILKWLLDTNIWSRNKW